MIDSQLPALGHQPLLRRACGAVHLAWISGIGVDQHQLADVVQKRGDHQPVAGAIAQLPAQPVGGPLRGDGVQPEPLGHALPQRAALEEVECASPAGDLAHALWREHVDGLDHALHPAAGTRVDPVGQPQHRDSQRHVALNRGHHVGRRGRAGLEQAQDLVAGFSQRRKRLQRLECGRQPAAVALVVVALPPRVGVSGRRWNSG